VSSATYATKESGELAPAKPASKSSFGSLRIGDPGDAYEREADRVAGQIMAGGALKHHWSLSSMRITAPLQRKCSCGGSGSGSGECEECKKDEGQQTVQRKASGAAAPEFAPPIVHEVLNSPGQPLDRATREFFEPKLGTNLRAVRVHHDEASAQGARDVGARAYTTGNHIAFADGEFAPWTAAGRSLLAHELVHVAQQAGGALGCGTGSSEEHQAEAMSRHVGMGGNIAPATFTRAPIHLARAEAPYVSPYTDALAAELLERIRQLRIVQGGATAYAQSQRVGAVAAVFDLQGNRLDTIERMNVPGGKHAEELIVEEIQNRIAAGQKIEYTVLMVDQDPCPGVCSPLLKEWRGNPASGTLRVVTPMAPNKLDPSRNVSGKTAYQRALTQDTVPVEPKTPPPNNAAYLGTRKEVSRVRPPLYKGPPSVGPGTGGGNPPSATQAASDVTSTAAADVGGNAAADATADVGGNLESAATKTLAKAEQQVGEHALADAAASRVAKAATGTAEKDLAETATEAFTRSATSTATRRLGQAAAPVIGAAFALPDAWRGLQDLAHGDIVTGLGTIGVAIVDVASQGLHLTDEVTGGGGTILAVTIQTWAAAMQFGFETARIKQRASELKAYMKAHGNKLPPRDELMSYYGLNDEDILILENDIYKAQQSKVTTEDLAKQVKALLAQIDENANKPLPEGVTPEGIQKERASLSKLLLALEADVQQKRARAAGERAAAEEKRRQENYDRAVQQQKQAAKQPPPQQVLPTPGQPPVQQQGAGAYDPLGIFGGRSVQPLNNITPETAELLATGAGRNRDALLKQYEQLEAQHFPSDDVKKYQEAVGKYVSGLDQVIDMFMKKGSREWQGVQTLLRLRDAADNADRSKLMR
jgi:Domain of unknown function (DUF4157)